MNVYDKRCGVYMPVFNMQYLHLVFSGHDDHVLCVQADEDKIISGSADKSIKVGQKYF